VFKADAIVLLACLAAIGLTGVALGIAENSLQSQDCTLNDQSSGDRADPPANKFLFTGVKGGIQKIKVHFQSHRTKKKNETAQDRASRRTADATVAIAILTAVTIAVGISQYVIFGRQLDVMENDKRPWLSANVSLDRYVAITEWSESRGIDVPLKFALKNYGQVPAVNIRINVMAWQHPGNPKRAEILPFQKRLCEQGVEAADKDPTGGIAIFPAETTIADANANVSGGEIYKDGEPTLWAIFGCVDYTYGNGKHGQTGFNFLLGKAVDGQVFGIPFVEGKEWSGAPSDE
jgi:hypothetical protein